MSVKSQTNETLEKCVHKCANIADNGNEIHLKKQGEVSTNEFDFVKIGEVIIITKIVG